MYTYTNYWVSIVDDQNIFLSEIILLNFCLILTEICLEMHKQILSSRYKELMLVYTSYRI
jgi:hypothetical protein